MWGEAALALTLADVVALSTGICRQEQDREGTGLGQSRSGRELEDRRPQRWKEENSVQKMAGRAEGRGTREGGSWKEEPTRGRCNHGSHFCVQSWIPTFHGNFTPVEFVASNFFLDSQFRVFLTIFLKSLSSWLLRLLLALSVYDSSWFSSEGHWQGSRYCLRLLTWQQKEPRITKKSEDWWAQELV